MSFEKPQEENPPNEFPRIGMLGDENNRMEIDLNDTRTPFEQDLDLYIETFKNSSVKEIEKNIEIELKAIEENEELAKKTNEEKYKTRAKMHNAKIEGLRKLLESKK